MDLRFVHKPGSVVQGESAAAKVASFLNSLYESAAETLPDIKDDEGVVMRAHQHEANPCDAYAQSVGKPSSGKSRKRKLDESVASKEVRFLPPGCMRDHYEAMAAVDSSERVSFKTFWKIWTRDFGHMRFRPASNHSQCNVCIRYKLMIRSLSNHILARQRQTELLAEHLRDQYKDRIQYWSLRGTSRLGCTHLVCILDGMDQAKFMCPRTRLCAAKDLNSMQRPRLHVSGCIIHGWGLGFFISLADHSKDSSCMVEILNIVLSRVFGGLATHLVRHLKTAETPADFVRGVQQFCEGARRPYEKERFAVQLNRHRDWNLVRNNLFLASAFSVGSDSQGAITDPYWKLAAADQRGEDVILRCSLDPTGSIDVAERFMGLVRNLESKPNKLKLLGHGKVSQMIENLELISVGFPCGSLFAQVSDNWQLVTMPPQKRKSGAGAESGAKAKAAKAANGNRIVVPVEFQDCVKQITGWLREKVAPMGGLDKYIASVYPEKADLLSLAEWIDEAFPPDGRVTYCDKLVEGGGAVVLRPFQLGYRSDFSFSGVWEPEDMEGLMEIILCEGRCPHPAVKFRSNSETTLGAERLAIIAPLEAMLASASSIYCLASKYGSTREMVYGNRGVTIQHSLRKAPHAFNLLRQIADWSSATAMARVFAIGKTESDALFNLNSKIDRELVVELKTAVSKRGLRYFLTHDCIARNTFNEGWSSAQGLAEAWRDVCVNADDGRLVPCLLQV
eukprot:s436_g49.t1